MYLIEYLFKYSLKNILIFSKRGSMTSITTWLNPHTRSQFTRANFGQPVHYNQYTTTSTLQQNNMANEGTKKASEGSQAKAIAGKGHLAWHQTCQIRSLGRIKGDENIWNKRSVTKPNKVTVNTVNTVNTDKTNN